MPEKIESDLLTVPQSTDEHFISRGSFLKGLGALALLAVGGSSLGACGEVKPQESKYQIDLDKSQEPNPSISNKDRFIKNARNMFESLVPQKEKETGSNTDYVRVGEVLDKLNNSEWVYKLTNEDTAKVSLIRNSDGSVLPLLSLPENTDNQIELLLMALQIGYEILLNENIKNNTVLLNKLTPELNTKKNPLRTDDSVKWLERLNKSVLWYKGSTNVAAEALNYGASTAGVLSLLVAIYHSDLKNIDENARNKFFDLYDRAIQCCSATTLDYDLIQSENPYKTFTKRIKGFLKPKS